MPFRESALVSTSLGVDQNERALVLLPLKLRLWNLEHVPE